MPKKKNESQILTKQNKLLMHVLPFFDTGFEVYFMPFKLTVESKKLKITCIGTIPNKGKLILADSAESEAFCFKNRLEKKSKEEFVKQLNINQQRIKSIRETNVNKRHGFGLHTNLELKDITITIRTSQNQKFEKNALSQKQWMAKTKRHNYLNKTEAEQKFINSFSEELIRKHFRIQHEIIVEGHPYFFDFYLFRQKIAIEIDGDYHLTEKQMEKDTIRDQILRRNGIKVLRIHNENAQIENTSIFLKTPFIYSDAKYELYFGANNNGGVFFVYHNGEKMLEEQIKYTNLDKYRVLLFVFEKALQSIPVNSIVIAHCQNYRKFTAFLIDNNKYNIIQKRFYLLQFLYLDKGNKKLKRINGFLTGINSNRKYKQNNMTPEEILPNNTIKVLINASAQFNKNKLIKATGVAYKIIYGNRNAGQSSTCLDGHKFTYHSAILYTIGRLIEKYIPNNSTLLIQTTDTSAVTLNKKQRRSPRKGIELIEFYDRICEEKNIISHIEVLKNVTDTDYMHITEIARSKANEGLKNQKFFIPNTTE